MENGNSPDSLIPSLLAFFFSFRRFRRCKPFFSSSYPVAASTIHRNLASPPFLFFYQLMK
jgi:hypothetical protein